GDAGIPARAAGRDAARSAGGSTGDEGAAAAGGRAAVARGEENTSMAEVQRVTVVGAGTMGNGIAHVFAQHGYEVVLIDVAEDRLAAALDTIGKNLDRQIRKGVLPPEAREETLGRIRTATATDAAAGSGLIVEAVPEDPVLKGDVIRALDAVAGDGILASNTSSISITKLAAVTRHPDRFVGMHFMNPVPVMQLVEVIRGLQTSDETAATVIEVAKRL